MANTKKTLEEEFTKAPQAETVEDVNNQDARTRLWQSLNTTYSNQMDESDKAYDKSISQQNNAMLARGMGRSSYAAQVSANMFNDKNRARNKLGEALIADYQNRIGQIEAQEKEDERWERQFAAQEEQNAWQRGFQEAEAARQQGNWEKDYAANRADTAWSQNFQTSQFAYQQQRDKIADQQWQKQYDEQLRQFNENMAYQRERANVSDAQWQKTYDENLRQFNAQMAQQEAQFKANYDFQVSEANRQQSNWEIQQAFAEKQWQAQQDQWKQEYDYNKMSNDQKIAFSVITAALESGNDADDATLKRAGISRAEFNTMKKQAQASGVVSSNPDKKETTPKNMSTEDAFNAIMNAGSNNKTHAQLVTTSLNNHEKSHATLVTTSKK